MIGRLFKYEDFKADQAVDSSHHFVKNKDLTLFFQLLTVARPQLCLTDNFSRDLHQIG